MSDVKKLLSFLTISLLLLILSCSEVIDIPVIESGGQLVISGRVSNSTEGNYVSVHRTGVLGRPPEPVLNAEVRVISGNGDVQRLIAADSGFYKFRASDFRGEPGQEYSLKIQLNGQRYYAHTQRMPTLYGRDSLYFELSKSVRISTQGVLVEDDVLELYMDTHFDQLEEEFYIRWDLEEAYTYLGTYLPANHFPPSGGQVQCFVTNRLNQQKVFLHNGRKNRAQAIPGQHLFSRPIDKSFQALHYFNVIRSSLSSETHRYWSQLDRVVNRQGSIFDTAPAAVRGNIISETGEEVLGYFEVVSVDTTRLAVTRNDVPLFFYDECVKRGEEYFELFSVPLGCRQCLIDEGIVAPQCLDCQALPGSSYTRPSYF
ncbi:MAG: DUF4249 domain-containing protein [Roseivirga sp.]|nr:DUF4249 domain-containing protein [Roseivirga sp.]